MSNRPPWKTISLIAAILGLVIGLAFTLRVCFQGSPQDLRLAAKRQSVELSLPAFWDRYHNAADTLHQNFPSQPEAGLPNAGTACGPPYAQGVESYYGASNVEAALCAPDDDWAIVGEQPWSELILDMGADNQIFDESDIYL